MIFYKKEREKIKMPNYCDYTLKVVGGKEEIKTFISYLENDYHYFKTEDEDRGEPFYPSKKEIKKYKFHYNDNKGNELLTNALKHFYRVFEADVMEEGEQDDKYYAIISGDCAWSVHSCMMSGPGSYYSDNVNDNELRKEHSTTLVLESENLKLKIEYYSAEPGMGFAEHCLIDNGKILIEEEFEYNEFYLGDYETKKDAEEELGIEISNQEWENPDRYVTRCDINPFDPYWNV